MEYTSQIGRCAVSKLIWCWAVPLHSDVIEYSLTKLLEKLQISHEEVRLWCLLRCLWKHILPWLVNTHHRNMYLIELSFAFFPLVCWPVYFAGLWLLRKDHWFGSKESSYTDPEAPHHWECGFTCQQKGIIGHLFFVIHCFTKENAHSTLKWYSHLLPSRRILCHISGNTKKHGLYSWMHHSLKLLNSSGLSQMKKA